jgi:hypothetical protein
MGATVTAARRFIWRGSRPPDQRPRFLIALGADPNVLDSQRYDAVTVRAVCDDLLTKALLTSGASAKLITSRYDGTALIAAAHLWHDGVARELIKAGAPRIMLTTSDGPL